MLTNRTISRILAVAAIGALTLSTLTSSLAGPKRPGSKPPITHGKMGKGTSARHIKMAKGINKRGKEVHKKRGETGTIVMQNLTGWYVDCYVDGNSVGQVGPYASLFVHPEEGDHELYAVAKFTDGTEKTFGPETETLSAFREWPIGD